MPVRGRRGRLVHGARELEDLVGELEQLAVLPVLLLHGLPLLVGEHLPPGVGAVPPVQNCNPVSLAIGTRERIAVLTLAALILGGGLFPQPGVTSRNVAAERILEKRRTNAAIAERMANGEIARADEREDLAVP